MNQNDYLSGIRIAASAGILIVVAAFGQPPVSSAQAAKGRIGYHEAKTDAAGKIMPWYGSGPSEAYDHVVRLVFDFWLKMRNCPNGVPLYLQHQVWKPETDDPRG